MLFAPTINYMSEWFDKKKSLAYGIMYVECHSHFKETANTFKDAEWVASSAQSFLRSSHSASKDSASDQLSLAGPSVSSSLRARARRVSDRGFHLARRSNRLPLTSASFASHCSGSCLSPRWFKDLLITSLASISHPAPWTFSCPPHKDLSS